MLRLKKLYAYVGIASLLTGLLPAGVSAAEDAMALPDLVVSDVAWSLSEPKAGEQVTFRAKIENLGSELLAGSSVKVDFYVDNNPVPVASSSTDLSFTQGKSRGLVATSKWTATLGSHTIRAVVDSENVINESIEMNNERTRMLFVSENATPGSEVYIDDSDAALIYSGPWETKMDWGDRSHGSTHEILGAGTVQYTFTGASSIKLIGELQPWGGTANVSLDGEAPIPISYNASSPAIEQTIYARSGLDPSQNHTITINTVNGFSYIDGFILNLDDLAYESIATLQELRIEGKAIPGFSQDQLEYTVELPHGTTEITQIIAKPTMQQAQVEITYPQTLQEPALIKVTSPNGQQTKTYKVNFTVSTTSESVPNMGEGWYHTDIGEVGTPGTAVYNNGELILKGAGNDIFGNQDAFHYAFKQISGNFDIQTRVTQLDNVDDWTKSVIMFRESLSPGSRYFAMVKPANNTTRPQWRTSPNGATFEMATQSTAQWIRIVRKDDKFESFYSIDGQNWTLVTKQKLAMSNTYYVGFGVTSHRNPLLAQANFDSITSSIPVSDQLSSDATVKDIRVNGLRLPDFDPAKTEYEVLLSTRFRSKATPVVTATPTNEFSEIEIDTSYGAPGMASIIIKSEDGTATKNYHVSWSKSNAPEKISSTTSWVGNTFSGIGDTTTGEWAQNFIDGAIVTPDGTVYTESDWDEAGRKFGIYKDGRVIGNQDMNIDAKKVVDQNGATWSIVGTEIIKQGSTTKITSAWRPTALAVANNGQLMVADNKRSQILFYDISQPDPVLVDTFGELGGISAGVPGEVTPTKFWGMTGIGMDAEGNIYVAMSEQGTMIRKLTPSGELVWQVEGMSFVDNYDFDPTTDGEDIYGLHEHYRMDYSKPAGEQATLVGYTMDLNKYPNDPRGEFMGGISHTLASTYIRYINGEKFMFATGMFGHSFYVYRFEGELAIPSGIISATYLQADFGDGSHIPIPNQPARGSGPWVWRDLNGDGDFQAEEFTLLPVAIDNSFAWDVDANGSIWKFSGDQAFEFQVDEIDGQGNPVYNLANTRIFPLPGEFTDVRRIQYDSVNDTMYITGYDEEDPYEGTAWGSMGRVIKRYDNWLTAPTLNSSYPLRVGYHATPSDDFAGQGFNISPQSMRVEGDRLFVVYGARGPLGYKTGELHVFDKNTTENLGAVTPGPEVGGFNNVGWVDIPHAIKALRTSDGNYKLLVEEDAKAKQLLYTITPYNGIPVIDEDEGGKDLPTIQSQRSLEPVEIDGVLDESFWKLDYKLEKQIGIAQTSNEVQFGTAWDANYLYVGVKVKDSALYGETPLTPWEDDAIEIFVDGNNDKGGAYDKHDVQYIKSWNNTGLFASNGKKDKVKHAIAGTPDGYTVEMAIPWSDLSINPFVGRKIGFDVSNDDDMDGGGRDGALVWSGDAGNFGSTENFGNVVLSEDDGTIQKPDAPTGLTATSKTTNSVVLTWIAPENHNDIVGYDLYNGDAKVNTATIAGTSYTVTGLTANTTYTFTVKAVDAAGNSSDASEPLEVVTASPSAEWLFYSEPILPIPGVIPVIPVLVNHDAQATVTLSAWESAVKQAKGRNIRIDVKPIEGAKQYTLKLPAKIFTVPSGQVVELQTSMGDMRFDDAMFASYTLQADGTVSISLSVAQADGKPVVQIQAAIDGKPINWYHANSPVQFSIPYQAPANELVQKIAVRRTGENHSPQAIPSGRYDAASGRVIFETTVLGEFTIVYSSKLFQDITRSYAQAAIEAMAAKGIITGTSASFYSPKQSISRADLVILIVRALQLDKESASASVSFADVAADRYYSDALATARSLAIINGVGDNRFLPEQFISRQDMMLIVSNVLRVMGKALPAAPEHSLLKFADRNEVAAYAEQAVSESVHAGLIEGDGRLLQPQSYVSREEIAVVISRLYDYYYLES